MDVSIIIVNYNTLKMTKECIDSVFEKTEGLEFEVILVDNGSTDGSKDFFVNDTRIEYIYIDSNLGFGKANNVGYKKASGDYLFLLNSDTKLVNNAVFLLWKTIKEENIKTSNIACGGCMLLNSGSQIIHSYAHFPSMLKSILNISLFSLIRLFHFFEMSTNTSNYDYEKKKNLVTFDVDYITGADLMILKSVADKHGLFDPDFFMYYEETEMQHRYMKYGYRRIIVSSPKIVHLEGKSYNKCPVTKVTMILKSLFLYFEKTTNMVNYSFFSVFFKFLYITPRILVIPLLKGNRKESCLHLREVLKM